MSPRNTIRVLQPEVRSEHMVLSDGDKFKSGGWVVTVTVQEGEYGFKRVSQESQSPTGGTWRILSNPPLSRLQQPEVGLKTVSENLGKVEHL